MNPLRRTALFVLACTLVLARPASFAQTVSASSPGWKTIADHIQVRFVQFSSDRCTWYFMNTDDARTLRSLRFVYSLSKFPMAKGPLKNPTSTESQDEIPYSIAPRETIGGENMFRVIASCVNVDIRVTDTTWSAL